ncbi:MAG: SpoIID/LytB domain-containing protein [Candidatus Stahlbacteria bacterium]|nr:SpoIID/LytB domain-containing protein [Candidatus Stahlbacteria bacterium]
MRHRFKGSRVQSSLVVIVCSLIVGCVPVYKMEKIGIGKEEPVVRVLIGERSEVNLAGNNLCIQNSSYRVRDAKFSVNGIWIGDKSIENPEWPIEIKSSDGIIKVTEKSYRGSIIVYKLPNKYIVINKVNMEDYLKGVVPCELRTPDVEALKAQAVACRSYALARVRIANKETNYDVKSTVADQVYGGIESETELTTLAIKETRGIVCTYNSEVINAQYHSTCGGKTCSGGKPYLTSQVCHFCESSPQYRWEQEYDCSDISTKIGEHVRGLEISERDGSGRVKSVKVLSETGNQIMSGEDLRNKIGLKSRFFDIQLIGERIKIIGRGYGHGIGLCQFGAMGMARKGHNYKSILKYYYKGIEVERIY